jgi:hypothetical protein
MNFINVANITFFFFFFFFGSPLSYDKKIKKKEKGKEGRKSFLFFLSLIGG